MEIVISFCITVYNQSDLLRQCIDSIVEYKGQDIEVVISDDRSSENIEALIESYHDDRIIYKANKTNQGHDRNILNAFEASSGKYAFLLRTRDRMIPDAVPELVRFAREHDASYITGAALNQLGQQKMIYSRLKYKKGREAIEANYKLYVHPSGGMYRVSDIDTVMLRSFLNQENVSKTGFVVHNLIRLALADKGDFELISRPIWIYTDTESADDKAVNHVPGRISVYDPSLVVKRYEAELSWSRKILKPEDYYYNFLLLSGFYLDQLTWNFMLTNADKRSQKHYQFDKRNFSVREERKEFRRICEQKYDKCMNVTEKRFKRDIREIFLKSSVNGSVKYAVRKLTGSTGLYRLLNMFYKRIFRGI